MREDLWSAGSAPICAGVECAASLLIVMWKKPLGEPGAAPSSTRRNTRLPHRLLQLQPVGIESVWRVAFERISWFATHNQKTLTPLVHLGMQRRSQHSTAGGRRCSSVLTSLRDPLGMLSFLTSQGCVRR